MRIYFTASITDIPAKHKKCYQLIVDSLKELGHRVTGDHVFGELSELLTSRKESDREDRLALERKMIAWKNQADLVVAEVSYPDLTVGQEMEYVLTRNKPVIAMHIKNRKPQLLKSVGKDQLHIVEYSLAKVKEVLNDYIEYARDTADTRFNFFISSEIEAFLDWVAKKRKLPRAVFLRQLIEEDMSNNKAYLRETGRKRRKK